MGLAITNNAQILLQTSAVAQVLSQKIGVTNAEVSAAIAKALAENAERKSATSQTGGDTTSDSGNQRSPILQAAIDGVGPSVNVQSGQQAGGRTDENSNNVIVTGPTFDSASQPTIEGKAESVDDPNGANLPKVQ